ncbi:hypothetical protein ACFFRR_003755 [Megaselia abdita]
MKNRTEFFQFSAGVETSDMFIEIAILLNLHCCCASWGYFKELYPKFLNLGLNISNRIDRLDHGSPTTFFCEDHIIDNKFIWSINRSLEYHSSVPECFDDDGLLVVRKCSEGGEWIPGVNKCNVYKSNVDLNCPKPFQYILNENSKHVCLEYYGKEEFQDTTIAKGRYGFDPSYLPWKYLLETKNISKVWLPFQITDLKHMHTFTLSPVYNRESLRDYYLHPAILSSESSFYIAWKIFSYNKLSIFLKKQCVVVNKYREITMEKCSEKHHSAFAYVTKDLVIKSDCPSNSAAFIHRPNICFGVIEGAPKADFHKFYENFQWIVQARNQFFPEINRLRIALNSDIISDDEALFSTLSTNSLFIEKNEELVPYLNYWEIEEKLITMELKLPLKNVLELKCTNCNLLFKNGGLKRAGVNDFGFYCYYSKNREGSSLGYLLHMEYMEKYDDNTFIYNIFIGSDYDITSYFWCQGYSIFGYRIVKSNRVLNKPILKSNINQVIFNYTVSINDGKVDPTSEIERWGSSNILQNTTFLEISSVKPYSIDLTVYAQISKNFDLQYVEADVEQITNQDVEIAYTGYCPEETLNSTYPEVYWMSVGIGENSTLSNGSFVAADGTEPKRKCVGAFEYGSFWENITDNYAETMTLKNLSDDTKELEDILKKSIKKSSVTLRQISEVLDHRKTNISKTDVMVIVQIVGKIANDFKKDQTNSTTLADYAKVTDRLLNTSRIEFSSASVHDLRSDMDKLATRLFPLISVNELGVGFYTEKNYIMLRIQPHKANITGIAFYKRKVCGRTHLTGLNLYYKLVTRNTTVDDFRKFTNNRDTKVAFFFPENVMQYLEDERKLKKVNIFVEIFSNDNFYQTGIPNNKTEQRGDVLKISIEGLKDICFRNNFFPIAFENKFSRSMCRFWGEMENDWNDFNIKDAKPSQAPKCVLNCTTNHLTSFAKLLTLDDPEENRNCDPVMDEGTLSNITKISLGLSVAGVTGIFSIAILLKKWRQRTEVKIFLQLSAVTVMKIVIFFVDTENEFCDLAPCIAIGSSLQYMIIAQLFWMFIYTVFFWLMIYKPFTFSARFTHGDTYLITIISLIGWGVPVIPVALSLWFGRHSFDNTYFENLFCLPSYHVKLWGFIAVIFLILLLNVLFYILIGAEYIKILRNRRRFELVNDGRKEMLQQMIILVFIIGLPWTLGVFHMINSTEEQFSPLHTYLFCAVVPLQGFLIFLTNMIFNGTLHDYTKPHKYSNVSSSRTHYVNYYKNRVDIKIQSKAF